MKNKAKGNKKFDDAETFGNEDNKKDQRTYDESSYDKKKQ